MLIKLDEKLKKELEKIKLQDPKLFKRIEKQLSIFALNPRHKSLRLHKLSGELENLWSISINMSIRMTYVQGNNEAYFFDIGTHEQIYKKK